jgi:LacI family transcriptional regulator
LEIYILVEMRNNARRFATTVMGRRALNSGVQRIALLLPMDIESGRAVLRGVKSYIRPDRPWTFHIALPTLQIMPTLRAWKPSGVIAHVDRRELIPALRRLRTPVINICNALAATPFPRVGLNNNLVGRLAAEHYLQRGLSDFAFVGDCRNLYVRDRREAFRAAVMASSHATLAVFDAPSPTHWGENWALTEKRLHRWMMALPKPVGVLTANDQLGLQLTEVCRMIGLRVPDEVSIVGVDNDELICQLSNPPLSSISGGGEQTGHAAAAMLDRCMRGDVPREPVLLPPAGLIARQSSDILTIKDPDVQNAVRFIREHAIHPLAVDDVLGEVHLSRRSIERKFRSLLGRTLLEEIRRVRLDHVKRLLNETDRTVADIAEQTGFSSPERLTIVFRDAMGVVPTMYREQFRQRG